MSVTRIGSSTGVTSRGPTASDVTMTVNADDHNVVVDEGDATEHVVDDTIRLQGTGATLDREFSLSVSLSSELETGDVTFESLTESIATVSPGGVVSRVADGRASILVKSRLINRRFSRRVYREAGTEVDEWLRFAAASAGEHFSEQIDDRLDGLTPSDTTLNVFSVQNHSTGTYVRNSNCWAADVDLTPISPWQSNRIGKRGAIAISPLHVGHAQHETTIAVGDTLRFVDANNNVITRQIVAQESCPGYHPVDSRFDVRVSKLNTALPSSIDTARILPSDWADHFTTNGMNMPLLYTDQHERLYTADVLCLQHPSQEQWPMLTFGESTVDDTRAVFCKYAVSGDSGNPLCLPFKNKLIWLGSFTTPNYATFVAGIKDEINTMMTTLGGGYQLTEVESSELDFIHE